MILDAISVNCCFSRIGELYIVAATAVSQAAPSNAACPKPAATAATVLEFQTGKPALGLRAASIALLSNLG